MGLKKKVTISWSGGKDSAFALYKVLLSGEFEVAHLHTVIDKSLKRVGLHGVREELIEKQAEHIGLPLEKIYLPASNEHDVYSDVMKEFYRHCSQTGVQGVVFGDLFLEDLKVFRLELIKPAMLEAYFPLWKLDTRLMAGDFINAGFRTILCSADSKFFSEHRNFQDVNWFHNHFQHLLQMDVNQSKALQTKKANLEEQITERKITSKKAAEKLLSAYYKEIRKRKD